MPIIRPLPIVSDQIRADKVVITPSVITVYANVWFTLNKIHGWFYLYVSYYVYV